MANPFVKGWKYLMALFNSKIDEKADPKVQIQQAIEDAQRQHQALSQQAASVIGNQRQLEMKLNRQLDEVEKLNASARQAVLMADQATAAGDTEKAIQYTNAAEAFAAQLVTAEQSVEDLKVLHDQSLQAAAQAKKAVEQNAMALQQKVAERNPAVRAALASPDTAHVLLTRTGSPIRPSTIAKMLKWHAVRAGVGVVPSGARHDAPGGMTSRVSPHALRRAWATTALNDPEHPLPLDVVQEVEGDVRTLLMIGHNPGFEELAHLLIGHGDRYAAARMSQKYPTCGLAVIDFATEHWYAVAAREGRLDRFVTPGSLGEGPDE